MNTDPRVMFTSNVMLDKEDIGFIKYFLDTHSRLPKETPPDWKEYERYKGIRRHIMQNNKDK